MEQRYLLDSDMANVFAQFKGDIGVPGEQDTVSIHLSPANFTIGGGHSTLGFIISASNGDTLTPAAVKINSLAPGNVPTILRRDGGPGGSSLVVG